MDCERDDEIEAASSPPSRLPVQKKIFSSSIPRITSATYGGNMNVSGNPNNDWSYSPGANNMSYIHLKSVTNFSVQGTFPISRMCPGKYKGMFQLELTNEASGWQGCFVVSVMVPGCDAILARSNTSVRFGEFNLTTKSFRLTATQRNGSLGFSLSHEGPGIRKGLIIKRFVIEPAC
ncbi:uncharacterized protein LOC141585924 [Silene latifolia]|uniref:uncharacterized protein LOC141585924 n=1 Tax=Silene latifolia TaxID=37657 RepID=UPI003D782B42